MRTVQSRPLPLPDGACNEAFTLQSAARSSDRPLVAFSTKELWSHLLKRGDIAFARLQPSVRNAMLIMISQR
jgi:hypothetical protein